MTAPRILAKAAQELRNCANRARARIAADPGYDVPGGFAAKHADHQDDLAAGLDALAAEMAATRTEIVAWFALQRRDGAPSGATEFPVAVIGASAETMMHRVLAALPAPPAEEPT